MLFRHVLQEICQLAANIKKIQEPLPQVTSAVVQRMLQSGRGTLLIAHERERAAAFLVDGLADAAVARVTDSRAFNTVLCAPDLSQLTDIWQDIILLDGDVLPGEAAAIREKCPRARLHAMKANPAVTELLGQLAMADEPLREIYRQLKQGAGYSAPALANASGLTQQQVLAGLTAFRQVQLIDFTHEPWQVRLLPPVKCRMDDSPLIHYLRTI